MSIIDQIIDLDAVARMTGSGLERYHMSRAEFMRMTWEIDPCRFPDAPDKGLVGYVFGIPIIVVEAKA